MNFEIVPHVGIGPVKLGMSQEEVKSALGGSAYTGSNNNSDYYFSNSLVIEFTDEKASFIGLSYSNEFIALYQGKNVFDIEASELFRLIAQHEPSVHKYNSYEYMFPNQIITLWDADEQYDYLASEQRVIWAQIGLGSKVYLRAVSEIA